MLYYGKCSKISNTFLFLFSNKILLIRAGIHKMLVRIANREDPDQTAYSKVSGLSLHYLCRPFWQATSDPNFRTFSVISMHQHFVTNIHQLQTYIINMYRI